MKAFINEPDRLPILIRFVLFFAEKKLGRKLLPARLLSWYPKAALGAGVMEGLVAHHAGAVSVRLLKLIRMQVSFQASCPFCINMNSSEFAAYNITAEEISALQGSVSPDSVISLTAEEKIALKYVRGLTATPVFLDEKLIQELKERFTEKEIVVLASTAGQVNFWTRTIQGLGIPSAGFPDACDL